ncbi:hypothetical protein, partial [Mailhella sp.]|uniref:hypothetical protein n=1 Tax=Mailhella sp. TaxID=1981029 RepID=UPI004063E6BC
DILARNGFRVWNWSSWWSLNSAVIVSISVSLLLLFRKIRLNVRPWINRIAACMLGVYLIHDNNFVRPWLWKKVCHVADHFIRSEFIYWGLMTIVLVLCVCTIIEFLRMYFMDRMMSRILYPLKKWDDKIAAIMKED